MTERDLERMHAAHWATSVETDAEWFTGRHAGMQAEGSAQGWLTVAFDGDSGIDDAFGVGCTTGGA